MTRARSGIELFHGYTYSGHPLACAAGLATLEVYEDEGLLDARGRRWRRTGKTRCTRCAARRTSSTSATSAWSARSSWSRAPARPARAAYEVFVEVLRGGRADPRHRRHHRAVAAADHREGADRPVVGTVARFCRPSRKEGVSPSRAARRFHLGYYLLRGSSHHAQAAAARRLLQARRVTRSRTKLGSANTPSWVSPL